MGNNGSRYAVLIWDWKRNQAFLFSVLKLQIGIHPYTHIAPSFLSLVQIVSHSQCNLYNV